jgi:hypothetical protein
MRHQHLRRRRPIRAMPIRRSREPNVTGARLVRAMAEDYLVFDSPHEYVAYALWAAHTHVYEFF